MKETLNEQLGQPINEGLTIAGPNNEPGDVHTLAVGIPNNKGLYICYDTYTGIVGIINTPNNEPGDAHTLAVGIPNNKGLYICYDTYTGIVEIINTPDIEKYVISKSNERYDGFKGISTNGIRDIKKLKQGQSVRTGEADSLIVTCLEGC